MDRLRAGVQALVCVLPLASAAASCSSAPAAVAPPAARVAVATPRADDVAEYDEYPGRFEATETVEVRARVQGYLTSVHFRDGQIVRRGDLLFKIDPRPYQAALDQVTAEVTRAETRLDLARTDQDRGRVLFDIRGISQEDFDRRLQARREAEASLLAARAAQRAAQLDVEFTDVRAPLTGRVSDNFVSVGNLVSGGQAASTLLTTIVALDPIQFVFDVDEASYLRYTRLNATGQRPSSRDTANPVAVRLLDEREYTRTGRMDFVDNRLNATTGTLRGRALLSNADGFLSPGQFGRLRLIGSGTYRALLLPDDAILTDQARRFVWVVDERNTPSQRIVEVGRTWRGLRIVRAGLEATDRVVVGGLQRVRPGAPVTPVATVIGGADQGGR